MPLEMTIPENPGWIAPNLTVPGFFLASCGTLLLSSKYSLYYHSVCIDNFISAVPPYLSGGVNLPVIRFREGGRSVTRENTGGWNSVQVPVNSFRQRAADTIDLL